MTDAATLTIRQAQTNWPWSVAYSAGVHRAIKADGPDADRSEDSALVPHLLGSHAVLHASKATGKIAAVYEGRDHSDDWTQDPLPGREVIRKAAADLVATAMRFANLEGFDLAEALIERALEKSGVDFGSSDSKPWQPHVAEKRFVLTEIHVNDAYFEDQHLIGSTFVRTTEWESPHESWLAGEFRRLSDGEHFTFLAAKFEVSA